MGVMTFGPGEGGGRPSVPDPVARSNGVSEGGTIMRILVSAASRHDATNEVAAAIAATLEREGLEVDVRRPEEVGHLTGYDGAVLGSGVYAGRWLKPATDLVDRLAPQLVGIPVWLFSSGPVGDPLKPEGPPIDATAMREQTGARDHRTFGGRLDRSALGFGEKAIVRLVGAAEGDFRRWDEIEAWAGEIATALKTSVLTPQSV
jgi:menaquinone-dependent protoporphyrinogen oxidase